MQLVAVACRGMAQQPIEQMFEKVAPIPTRHGRYWTRFPFLQLEMIYPLSCAVQYWSTSKNCLGWNEPTVLTQLAKPLNPRNETQSLKPGL